MKEPHWHKCRIKDGYSRNQKSLELNILNRNVGFIFPFRDDDEMHLSIYKIFYANKRLTSIWITQYNE